MDTMGRIFRVSLFGESHGGGVGAVVDGCPPGLPLDAADLGPDLARRRSGSPGTTSRAEPDLPELLSGVWRGRATGTPILILFRNTDTRSEDYEAFANVPRPGHADFAALARYGGFADPRGSGHFSGRVTVGLVAAGAIAKKILGSRAAIPGEAGPAGPVAFSTRVLEAGGSTDVEASSAAAAEEGDSVGGLVELRVSGLPAGLGEPFFDSVEGLVARAIFAVPGVRGVEFGDGFAAARMRGSGHNDPFVGRDGRTSRNGAGGVNGGITNGNELLLRVAMKPASTIARPQRTLDFSTGAETELSGSGRHDACIAIRAAVALEAACAAVLADLYLMGRALGPSARAGAAPGPGSGGTA